LAYTKLWVKKKIKTMKMNFMTIFLFPTSLLKSMIMATMNGNDMSSCFFKSSGAIDIAIEK